MQSAELFSNNFLFECSWEVCNQMGGIYTVIRSKLPAVTEKWQSNYCLIGPLVSDVVNVELEEITETDSLIGRSVAEMRNMGFEVRYGTWLVSGRPKTVLFNPNDTFNRLDFLKQKHRDNNNIPIGKDDSLYDVAFQWCDLVQNFMRIVSKNSYSQGIIFHGHEWMTCPAILDLANNDPDIKTVFTTHATRLGRVLAINHADFYNSMYHLDDEKEAAHYGIPGIHKLEKEGARLASVFTTVSNITAEECEALLKTKPHEITPNGLNIDRFGSYHTVHLRHEKYRKQIEDFVVSHFFGSQPFNLDKTLYFFTSGRYEHQNKGFDLIIKSLQRLNKYLIEEKVDITVVMFFITKSNVTSINPDVLHAKALMHEVEKACSSIEKELANKLFIDAVSSQDDHRLPDLNNFVNDYWRLRYRRTIQAWKTDKWPYIVTHNLVDDQNDPILNDLRNHNLFNNPTDKVKVVYHPDFISPSNPLFGMEYSHFVRGSHLGVFPSYYEPWGYTPLECIARGVSAITSDLSGFGSYTEKLNKNPEDTGIYVLKRKQKSNEEAAEDLARMMLQFSKTTSSFRSIQRNKLEEFSQTFDWKHMSKEYDKAFDRTFN